MLEKIEAMFKNSFIRHISQGIAVASGLLFGVVAVITFFASLVASLWWFVACFISVVWCGASFGLYWRLER